MWTKLKEEATQGEKFREAERKQISKISLQSEGWSWAVKS